MTSELLLSKIEVLLRQAGKAVLDIYENLTTASFNLKDDNSPVTQADLTSHDIIHAGLTKITPTIPILSEEGNHLDNRQKLSKLWLVDPLDGTKEFLNKNGEFAIIIALIEDKNVTAAFVFVPVTDTFYYAFKGKGAFAKKDGKERKLTVSQYGFDNENLRFSVSRSHPNNKFEQLISNFQSPEVIPLGSVLKMLHIAEGKIELYPRLQSGPKEWDIAAGQLIIEEAGGWVYSINKKAPLEYNNPDLTVLPFIASAKCQESPQSLLQRMSL